jgi:hypothetical protein
VRQLNWQGHQFGSLITGESKHQTLVTGASRIHAHSNVWRLSIQSRKHSAGVTIKTVLGSCVTDSANGLASYTRVVDHRLGGNLTGNDNQTCSYESFAGDTGRRIRSKCCIKDGVRDLIGDLIGMSFGNGL